MAVHAYNIVEIEFEGKGWTLRLTQLEEGVHIGLHFGDKETPTHEEEITIAEMKAICEKMGVKS